MVPYEKLEQIVQRYEFLEAKLSSADFNDEIAELSREYAQLKPVVAEIRDFSHLNLKSIFVLSEA